MLIFSFNQTGLKNVYFSKASLLSQNILIMRPLEATGITTSATA